MPKTKQKARRKFPKALTITLTVVGGLALMAAVVILPKYIYDYNETYRDRPLAEGYEYIGRDYRNGCLFGIQSTGKCWASELERYYYATDIEPAKLTSSEIFADWQTDQKDMGVQRLWNYDDKSVVYEYTAHGTFKKPTTITYKSYEDLVVVRKASKLKKTTKRYIISIDRNDYKIFRGIIGQESTD